MDKQEGLAPLPKLMLTLKDGAIVHMAANTQLEVTIHDRDLEAVGEPVGIVIQTSQPEDVRSPEDFERLRLGIINGLIDEGH